MCFGREDTHTDPGEYEERQIFHYEPPYSMGSHQPIEVDDTTVHIPAIILLYLGTARPTLVTRVDGLASDGPHSWQDHEEVAEFRAMSPRSSSFSFISNRIHFHSAVSGRARVSLMNSSRESQGGS